MEDLELGPNIAYIMDFYLTSPTEENLLMVENAFVTVCVHAALDRLGGFKPLKQMTKFYTVEFLSINLRTVHKGFPSNFIEAVFNVYNGSNGEPINTEPIKSPIYIHHDDVTITILERLKNVVEFMGDSYTVDFSREVKWNPENQ